MVERSEGCNHMTCECKTEFCYDCGSEFGSDNSCQCQTVADDDGWHHRTEIQAEPEEVMEEVQTRVNNLGDVQNVLDEMQAEIQAILRRAVQTELPNQQIGQQVQGLQEITQQTGQEHQALPDTIFEDFEALRERMALLDARRRINIQATREIEALRAA